MELSKDGWGPSLLNVASLGNNKYAVKDKYDIIVFALPVMVQRSTMSPHYLYLDSCSLFNLVFAEDYISDLETVRIFLRAGCNADNSTSDK